MILTATKVKKVRSDSAALRSGDTPPKLRGTPGRWRGGGGAAAGRVPAGQDLVLTYLKARTCRACAPTSARQGLAAGRLESLVAAATCGGMVLVCCWRGAPNQRSPLPLPPKVSPSLPTGGGRWFCRPAPPCCASCATSHTCAKQNLPVRPSAPKNPRRSSHATTTAGQGLPRQWQCQHVCSSRNRSWITASSPALCAHRGSCSLVRGCASPTLLQC